MALAASVTSRKVVEVPSRFLPGVHVGPGGALWRVVLDEPVTVRALADGTLHETTEVYVAVGPNFNEALDHPEVRLRICIASESQLDFKVKDYASIGQVSFPRRPEAALHLSEVVVVKRGENNEGLPPGHHSHP